MQAESRAFTSVYNGMSNVLINDVGVIEAFDPRITSPPQSTKSFKAVWDTGATNSAISSRVVAECQLVPSGKINVSTPSGSSITNTYLVNILLPNGVGVTGVRVSEAILAGIEDVLIGMDIIGTGDFAVSNKDGKTVFTFRFPSSDRIDFTQSPSVTTPSVRAKIGRNEKCPCGSGKKYKRCHEGALVASQ